MEKTKENTNNLPNWLNKKFAFKIAIWLIIYILCTYLGRAWVYMYFTKK